MKPRTLYRMCMDGTLFRKIEEIPPDSGMRAERKLHHEESKEAVNFCLNCTRKKCYGNCEDLKRFKRENGLGGKWRTRKDAKRFPYNGGEYTARELSEISGLHIETIRTRLKNGMTPEEAVNTRNSHAHFKRIGRLPNDAKRKESPL